VGVFDDEELSNAAGNLSASFPLGKMKRGPEAKREQGSKNRVPLLGFKFYFSAVTSSNDAIANYKPKARA